MNAKRIVLGGIVAAIVYYLGDGILHGGILQTQWKEISGTLGLDKYQEGSGMVWFAAYDLAKGIAAIFLYAAIRPRFGAGPRTAVIAGLIAWALAIPISLCGLLPLHFFGRKFAAEWSLIGAIPMVLGALAGAALYREEGTPAASIQPPLSRG
jgi:hypothetical protein